MAVRVSFRGIKFHGIYKFWSFLNAFLSKISKSKLHKNFCRKIFKFFQINNAYLSGFMFFYGYSLPRSFAQNTKFLFVKFCKNSKAPKFKQIILKNVYAKLCICQNFRPMIYLFIKEERL